MVTGLRASLENALNKKRTSSGGGRSAPKTWASSPTPTWPSRCSAPGVAIDRDAGEGRQITVRGLGGGFTRTRINGLEAMAPPAARRLGRQQPRRTMDFNVFASELFNSITVRKTGQAEVDEGSLGATIDPTTGRPFDLKKGFTARPASHLQRSRARGRRAPPS